MGQNQFSWKVWQNSVEISGAFVKNVSNVCSMLKDVFGVLCLRIVGGLFCLSLSVYEEKSSRDFHIA